MKLKNYLTTLCIGLVCYATASTERVAVVSFETTGDQFDPQTLQIQLELLVDEYSDYTIIDRYELAERLDQTKIEAKSCFSESCLRNAANHANANWALSGQITKLSDNIILILRMIPSDTTQNIRRTSIKFLNLPEQTDAMLKLTFEKLLDLEQDPVVLKSLTDASTLANSTNVPSNYLNLSGPRLGYSFYTGEAARILRAPKHEGGYDMAPAMFMFGYQFEQAYLKGDNIQGLFEFIPQVSGLDQGKFLPNVTFLNGLRDARSGFEFAFGPTFYTSRVTQKYFENGQWYRPVDKANEKGLPLENKADSRGFLTLETNLVFAVGKTVRSGNMNFPFNVFFVPNKDQPRFGFSLGYNIAKE